MRLLNEERKRSFIDRTRHDYRNSTREDRRVSR
jgi:hypothetical protein